MATMLLMPVKTDAQKLEGTARVPVPSTLLQTPRKATPKQLAKEEADLKKKLPLMFNGKVFEANGSSSLKFAESGKRRAAPLSLEPKVPLRAATDVTTGRELWANVIKDNTWADDDNSCGFYAFNAKSNITFDFLGTTNCMANGGGAIIGNRLYAVYYVSYWGKAYAYFYVFDTDTWEQQGKAELLSDYALVARETAVASDGTVYGEFYNADGNAFELGIADYANKTRSTIGSLTHAYMAMGITKDNTLYGVATDGKLYKIDTETAAETEIGSTGITVLDSAGKYYYQSGEIDTKTDVFYWATADANTQLAALYTIDLTTGVATKVGDFVNQNLMTLLTIPAAVADGAPSAVSDLVANFSNGDLAGFVKFNAPTQNATGEPLTGEITYVVTSSKDTLAIGKAMAGEAVTAPVTFTTDGMKYITVTPSNSDGDGMKARTSLYVGFDTPKAVQEVTLKLDDENGFANLNWDAVTEGVNNAYLGDITYDVVRYPDSVKVATGMSETSFTETLPKNDFKAYYYGVTAINGRMKGNETKSGSVIYGEAINLPYSEDFTDESNLALYTIIDNNEDDNTWTWFAGGYPDVNPAVTYMFSSDNDGDDWLITPPLKLEKDKYYTVSFKVRTNSAYFTERIEAKFGKGNTVADMTEELLPATELTSEEYVEFKKGITSTADGKIYIGFHAISEADMDALYLDDIRVEEGKSVQAPDSVANFCVVPGAKGAINAIVSFNAPTKGMDGTTDLSNLTVSIKRGGQVIKIFTDVSSGEALTYTDDEPAEGLNSYTVVAESEYGEGRETAAQTVFVGVDNPAAPENLTVADNLTSVRIGWDASEKGVNGGYVDPQSVKHYIYNIEEGIWSYDFELADSTEAGATSHDLVYKTDEGDQYLAQFAVSSVNDRGESQMGITPSVIVGKPYSIPFFESVSNGRTAYSLWWVNKNGGSSTYTNGDASSDDDGGSFVFTSSDYTDKTVLGSGKISLSGATTPVLVFSHKASTTSDAVINVYVQKPDGTRDLLKTINNNTGEWIREIIPLKPEYAALSYIAVLFESSASADETINFDEFYVRNTFGNDLALSDLGVSSSVNKGDTAKVNITVMSFGSNEASGYTVKLYAGNELVASTSESGILVPFASKTYQLCYKTSAINAENTVELKAEVEYANDQNPDDNVKSTSLEFSASTKPRPANVTAKESGSGEVTVEWSAVATSAQIVTDGFEHYNSWTNDEFGDWKAITSHTNAKTGMLFQNYSYPTEGQNFAFTLVDPLNQWITSDVLATNPSLIPHGGNKYLASFYAYKKVDQMFLAADNWLISPQLSGKAQIVNFWVSNINTSSQNYYETFDVLYSTGGTETADFVRIGDTHTVSSGAWQQVSVEIPAGATHFAIHQNTVADKTFVFMIDDVTYEAGAGEVVGYNVYRDSELIKSVAGKDVTSFVDKTAEGGRTYIYAVTAVFADGESEATIASAIVTNIENVEAAVKGDSYNVYTIDGKLVGNGMKSLRGLKSGSYIINGQKVVIR